MSTVTAPSPRPTIDEAVDAIVARALAVDAARPARVLIDGRSGSGKTTLAAAVAAAWPQAQLIALDAMVPGWDGLDAGSRHLLEHVLLATAPRWHEWDWDRQRPGRWHDVDPGRPILVEGSGALSRANRAAADLGVWIDEPDESLRRERTIVIRGDGDMYAPHWERWARQEQAFLDRERPDRIADLVIPGYHHPQTPRTESS